MITRRMYEHLNEQAAAALKNGDDHKQAAEQYAVEKQLELDVARGALSLLSDRTGMRLGLDGAREVVMALKSVFYLGIELGRIEATHPHLAEPDVDLPDEVRAFADMLRDQGNDVQVIVLGENGDFREVS
jgi:hypothetical protein